MHRNRSRAIADRSHEKQLLLYPNFLDTRRLAEMTQVDVVIELRREIVLFIGLAAHSENLRYGFLTVV